MSLHRAHHRSKDRALVLPRLRGIGLRQPESLFPPEGGPVRDVLANVSASGLPLLADVCRNREDLPNGRDRTFYRPVRANQRKLLRLARSVLRNSIIHGAQAPRRGRNSAGALLCGNGLQYLPRIATLDALK